MVPADVARAYIYRLCNEIGANADAIFNSRTGAWYFSSETSTIELFLTSINREGEPERTFMRCFSPICIIPDDSRKKMAMFQSALEINSQSMGVKVGALGAKGLLCAVTERDIDGMDYDEFLTIVKDIGYWADHLREYFKHNVKL